MGGVCVEWRKNAPRHRGAPEKWADCGPLPHENVVRALGRSPRASKNLIIRGSHGLERAAGDRAAVVTASGRRLPALMCSIDGHHVVEHDMHAHAEQIIELLHGP